jgi:hypothetical protein
MTRVEVSLPAALVRAAEQRAVRGQLGRPPELSVAIVFDHDG